MIIKSSEFWNWQKRHQTEFTTLKPDQDFVVWSRGDLRHCQRKYVDVIMLILYNDSHTYLVHTNYTDTCISHLLIIYKIGQDESEIHQSRHKWNSNKINTVFTDGIQQTRWS